MSKMQINIRVDNNSNINRSDFDFLAFTLETLDNMDMDTLDTIHG